MQKPKLLLDENIGKRVALSLRESGFDVASILEDAAGSTDADVLKRARKERRILVTLDRDFGALVFRDSASHVGVLYVRLQKESAESIIFVLENVLHTYGDKLKGRFTIASETGVRIR